MGARSFDLEIVRGMLAELTDASMSENEVAHVAASALGVSVGSARAVVRAATGRCVACGWTWHSSERLLCGACRDDRERYKRERREDHHRRGLCCDCNAPATRGGRCEFHASMHGHGNRHDTIMRQRRGTRTLP